jgi:LCP family protein required for cell wall assembly
VNDLPRTLRGPVTAVVLVAFALVLSGVDPVAWTAHLVSRGDPVVAAVDRPPRRAQPLYVLIVGSDSRAAVAGLAGHYGSAGGARADAVVLARIGADGVDLLSVPRDLRVPTGVGDLALAAVLEIEGAPAMVSTVRQVTGLPVHHYVEFEFADVIDVLDAMGGVEVAHANPVRDTTAGLDLPAGRVRLSGEMAVTYLRSRRPEALVGGRWVSLRSDDLARVERHQHVARMLMRSLRDRPRADALAALADARGAGASMSTLSWNDWPRLLEAALSGDVDLCTLPTRELRSLQQRSSPFAPAHPGALRWLVPVSSSQRSPGLDPTGARPHLGIVDPPVRQAGRGDRPCAG